jgi:hypothetical protein
VLQPHHVVDVRVLRQQLGLDALHREVGHAGHALHRLVMARMLRVPTEPSALR